MSNFNLTLSPSQIEFIAKSDSSFTQAYKVTNNSENTLILNTEILPWTPLGSDGSVSYDQVASNPHLEISLANADLTLGQTFVLKPSESKQLVIKIKSDKSTPLTDSYFTFFINQDISNSLSNNSNQTSASARIGSHILLSTSATEETKSKFSVSNIIISPQIIDVFYPKITITGLIQNDSNYFNKINGKLIISKNNLTIKEFTLFPHNVLSQSSREFSCLSDKDLVPCQLQPPFWPGLYTATISLNDSVSTSTTFFVFPITVILALFLVIFTVLSLVNKKHYSSH